MLMQVSITSVRKIIRQYSKS